MTSVNKIDLYAENIMDLARNQRDETFYNSSEKHAAIVHKALVKYANRYIYIFSDNMCSEISNNDDYCMLMDGYLKKDHESHIDIILTNFSDKFYCTPIAAVFKKNQDKVRIKRYDGLLMYKEKPAHFTISDDRAFRLETDIEKHVAFGNFNCPSKVEVLKTAFEKVFNSPLVASIPFDKNV